MEAWRAELEMEINNPYQSDILMEGYFDQQLGVTLSQDFPYPLCSSHENYKSLWDFDDDVIDQVMLPALIPNTNTTNLVEEMNPQTRNNYNKNNNRVAIRKPAASGGTKRKRHPSQVQDHIIAERKRRELLAHLFISLAALLPGLKKTDKSSVLGEAITYMKKLKEKVKVLEAVAANRTMVKKTQLIVDNESGDDNDSSCIMHSSNGNGGKDSDVHYLPEIQLKVWEKTLLLRLYCENGNGMLATLFSEIDKHEFIICSCSVVPFQSLSLHITIVAQMKTEINAKAKALAFVRTLRSSLQLVNSHSCPKSS